MLFDDVSSPSQSSCRVYAIVRELIGGTHSATLCGGSGPRHRAVYVSASHAVEIRLIGGGTGVGAGGSVGYASSAAAAALMAPQVSFVLKYEGRSANFECSYYLCSARRFVYMQGRLLHSNQNVPWLEVGGSRHN